MKKLTRREKETYWIFGILLGALLLFFLSYSFFQSLNKFNYQGVEFEKIREGDLILYRAIVPLIKLDGERVAYYFLFRTDPRYNDIPSDEIEFPRQGTVYLSINETGLNQCEYSATAVSYLSLYLREGGGFDVKAAVPDENLSSERVSYVTCETNPADLVIQLKNGEKTRIIKEKNNCYTIEIANCEILPAVEKFQLKSFLDAKERAQ